MQGKVSRKGGEDGPRHVLHPDVGERAQTVAVPFLVGIFRRWLRPVAYGASYRQDIRRGGDTQRDRQRRIAFAQ